MLGILGLDEHTERVYRELVQLGPCTVEALASRLGLRRAAVAESVASLETKSLATRDAGGLVHTAPPQSALGALLTAQRHALGQAELTVLDRAPAHDLPAASAFWHERTHTVGAELEHRHGASPAWRTAEAQSARIGRLLKQGQLQSQVLLLQRV